jgi:hypothetical protein
VTVEVNRVLVRRHVLQLEDTGAAAHERRERRRHAAVITGRPDLLVDRPESPGSAAERAEQQALRLRCGGGIAGGGGGEDERRRSALAGSASEYGRREAARIEIPLRRASPLPVNRASGTGSAAK